MKTGQSMCGMRTKRKLGFIDGTHKKPKSAADIEQWEVVNSMLVAWIMNTIEPTLRASVTMVEDAYVLWEDLKMQFSAGNAARVHELRTDIACCKQNGDSVVVYYGRLKKMWDELAVYKPLRSCRCGELTTSLQQDQDEERTSQFLMGLDNAKFGTLRSNITSFEPIPKLSQVYQRIVREERQQMIVRNTEERTEAVGFAVHADNRSRFQTGYNKEMEIVRCTHCGKTGHEISDCYQINGYPDYWGERGRGGGVRGSTRGRGRGGGIAGSYGRGRGRGNHSDRQVTANAAQVIPSTVTANATRREGDYDRQSLPQLSDEQWTALISFLNTPKPNNVEKLSGKSDTVEFIIDTGASHHMTWDLNLLSNVVDIVPCSIGLPDG
ncbi:unnamed protein product [Microthlaspi erraticum]|uniref:CCHC-type domain-containing protein n=1 Tax=Microthlaspi erraticum TaxID=1685480 RepID=A0A6D2I0P6_9BRAS|nr:unnamed protein product [Microthlaspi erraticum]CAA7052629.1 unnamed protein product [Microthlaspi erraticum]